MRKKLAVLFLGAALTVSMLGACERKGKRKYGEALGMIPVLGAMAMAIGYTVVM